MFAPSGRDLGLTDTESGANANTVAREVAVRGPAAADKSEGRTADNTAKPPVGAICYTAMIMLEQR